MKTIVTQQNFKECLDRVSRGISAFYIPTAYRITKITDKTIHKFNTINRPVIKPDSSGRGFRVSRGKNYDYVFDGGLIES
jgi:hypothetical protein